MSSFRSLDLIVLLFAGFPLATTASSQCQTLATLLPNKVSYAGSSTFISSIASYFYVQSRLSPACVVTPAGTDDVATIVKTLGSFHETDPATVFAIRGGGHSPNIGAADTNRGITIDMRSINNIEVKSNGSVTSVGAGAIWEDVYAELVPKNLGAVGGRVAGPGLGGLITGGK